MKKNIFVTGASGFVGKYLIKELVRQQYDVTIFVRKTSNIEELQNLPIKITYGDICDQNSVKEALKECPMNIVVIHLVANLRNIPYAEYYNLHVEGAKNLIAACKEKGIKRIIEISTTSTLVPRRNPYGETKNIVDLLFQQANFDLTILKPDFIYGKGGPGFTNNVNLLKNLPFFPMVGNGKYTKQPIHVTDVVKAIIAAVHDNETVGKTYIVAGKSMAYCEIINILKESLNVNKPVIHIPQSFFYLAAFFLKNKKNAPFTKGSLDGLVQDSNFDITPLQEELKINPIDFKEGVKISISCNHPF